MAHPDTQEAEAPLAAGSSVEARLGQYLGGEDENELQPGEDDEPAEGEEDDEADGDGPEAEANPEDEDGEPEAPAIDAPVSWGQDAKELFAQLPPALQTQVAEREAQREKFIQAKATEAADARRNAERDALSQVANINRQYAEQLDQYAQLLVPQAPDINLLRGTDDDRAYYFELKAVYDASIAQHQQLAQQSAAARQQADQLEAARRQDEIEQGQRILAERIEGWDNPETRAGLIAGIVSAGEALGYTREALNNADAADILALKTASEWKAKAEKYDALQKQKMATVRAAKELPKSARPGTPQPKGAIRNQHYAEARTRLKSSGSVDDAAAALKAFL